MLPLLLIIAVRGYTRLCIFEEILLGFIYSRSKYKEVLEIFNKMQEVGIKPHVIFWLRNVTKQGRHGQ
ncbi:hypothetical protein ACSBR1_018317 [Camellia fascicularis]